MAWPTLQDYNEAVQSPGIVFSDPELRDAAPETTRLGLPKGITGNFACVYRFTGPKGEWAVRCFHRRYAGQRQRYAEISRALKDLRLPYTVGFEYIDQGIRIRGQWYPILKMEWVRGVLLSSYIEQNLSKHRAIKALAAKWREMIAALRDAGVAHGDLQHGNILIVGGEIRLVDYDGMYVPGLAGMRSNETGHPNYQHPHRSGAQFGPDLDNFSAWAIYVSLVALVADPTLWEKTTRGDEALIFRRADFEFPAQSRAFGLLKLCGDKKVRELAKRFRGFGRLSLSQVPPLEVRPPRKPKPAPKPAPKPSPAPASAAPAAVAPKPARAVKAATSPPRGASTSGRLARGLGRAFAGVFIGIWWMVRGVALGGYVIVRAVLWRGPKYALVTLTGRRTKPPRTAAAASTRPASAIGKASTPAPGAGASASAAASARPAPRPAPGVAPARATSPVAPAVGPRRPRPQPPARRQRSGWGLVLAVLWWPFGALARGVLLLLRAVFWQAPRAFLAALGRSFRKLPPRRRRRVKLGGALAVFALLAASLVWYEALWPTFFLAYRPWLPPVAPVPSEDEEECEFFARPGARLYIDGELVSEEIPPIYRTVLPVGDHKVRFENTNPDVEGEVHEITIDVVKGEPARWVMNFVTGKMVQRDKTPVTE